ncbi:MAG TPA: branched-chain amino acid ABC transporter permease [Thermodesulfobacteriota bacterium]|nr:branched-chain amino acid ABC transporter permease [Thermodesulfobacteriota bacterium]
MELVLIQFLNSLSFISVLSLIGIGLAVQLVMMGVINLAHGEFLMLGAYVVWLLYPILHNFWIALFFASIGVGLFSLIVQRTIIVPLYRRPLDTILATWGVGIVIREMVRLVFGKGYKSLAVPIPGFVSFWDIQYSTYRLFIIAMGILVLFGVAVFFFKTEYGLWARAIMTNKEMTSAVGVNTDRVNQLVFAMGASLAALAGGLIAPIYTAGPYMGLDWLVGAFFVVVIGGVNTIWAPIGGAIVMGGSRGVVEYFLEPVLAQIIVLIIAIIVVRLRPQGLFVQS